MLAKLPLKLISADGAHFSSQGVTNHWAWSRWDTALQLCNTSALSSIAKVLSSFTLIFDNEANTSASQVLSGQGVQSLPNCLLNIQCGAAGLDVCLKRLLFLSLSDYQPQCSPSDFGNSERQSTKKSSPSIKWSNQITATLRRRAHHLQKRCELISRFSFTGQTPLQAQDRCPCVNVWPSPTGNFIFP